MCSGTSSGSIPTHLLLPPLRVIDDVRWILHLSLQSLDIGLELGDPIFSNLIFSTERLDGVVQVFKLLFLAVQEEGWEGGGGEEG